MEPRTRTILYADDSVEDRELLTNAAARGITPVRVACVESGAEAIRYLMGEGEYVDRGAHPFPTLIITDLKMPNGDGFSVLEFLRHNPAWSVVPRIVYSGSNDNDDVKKAFMLGASAYHVKGINGHSIQTRLAEIVAYWGTSEVPPIDTHGRLLMTDSRGKLGERFKQPAGGDHMERVP
jgi:CheY-like chemotaxis protein